MVFLFQGQEPVAVVESGGRIVYGAWANDDQQAVERVGVLDDANAVCATD